MSLKLISVIAILLVATGILASPVMAEPEYGITYEPDTVYVGDEVQFTANLLPDIPKTEEEWGYWYIQYWVWSWNFGDGEVVRTYAEQISHTYTEVGTYTVTLTWIERKVYYYKDTGKYAIRTRGGYYYTTVEVLSKIPATIDIDPDTLNLKSKGKWITAYIEATGDIDLCSVLLVTPVMETVQLPGGEEVEVPITVYHEDDPKYSFVNDPQIIDRDGDGVPELMVKFDRQELQAALVDLRGDVELKVTGTINGQDFEASDTIRVIMPGKGKGPQGKGSK